MGKGKKIGLFTVVTAVAIAAAVIGGGAYFVRSMQNTDGFLQGTSLNGQNVSGKTPAEAAAMMAEGFDDRQVVLLEDGKEVLRLPLTEVGYSVNMEKLEKKLTGFMEEEKQDHHSVFDGLLNGREFSAKLSYTVDKGAFAEAVTTAALSEPRKENVDAKLIYDDEAKKCVIEPEVQGTLLKDEDLQTWLRGEINEVLTREQRPEEDAAEAAEDGRTGDKAGAAATEAAAGDPAGDKAAAETEKDTADPDKSTGEAAGKDTEAAENAPAGEAGDKDAENTENAPAGEAGDKDAEAAEEVNPLEIVREIPASLYIPPKKNRNDKRLNEKCDVLNKYAGETITYDFGPQTETLEFKDFMDWLKIKDGQASVNGEKVAKYVRGLAEKYETRYMDRVFTTTGGYEVTFPAGLNEYGYTILEDLEAAQLTQDILSGQSVEREPVYQTVGAWGDPLYLRRNGTDDLAGTYVEVSLSAQHLWYYIDGALFIESDVVTGDVTQGMGTATGVFPLAFKESPATLRGGEGKKKYTTKVQYWMPFYEGQGLHDAWWKSVFGGSEYVGNGSHGCVNLPPSVAEAIFNNIVPGTAIIIYN